MFLSTTYKLLFLEVPRTGSHSVTEALVKLDPFAPTQMDRVAKGPMHQYHMFQIPEAVDDSYTIVATHRNPYSRIWSHWKYRHERGNPKIFTRIDWPSYARWACSLPISEKITGAINETPITRMPNTDKVDFWLRYENLAESWQALGDQMGICLPRLRHINQSTRSNSWSTDFNEQTAKMLADYYTEDFAAFDYAKDSWKSEPRTNVGTWPPESDVSSSLVTNLCGRRRKVAILSALHTSNPAYSLNRVIQDQLAMLLKHQYKPRMTVLESEDWDKPEWPYSDPSVELVRLPKSIVMPHKEGTAKQREENLARLLDALEGVEVVLTHDLIFQNSTHLLHTAFRTANLRPDIKWLHWIHSATSPKLLKRNERSSAVLAMVEKQAWPNSYPVFPARMLVPRISINFNYAEEDVKVVPHPIDVCRFFDFSPLMTRLYEEKSLYLADFLVVCPARLDRGKQVEWVIKIVARLKTEEHRVRLLILDYHSQDQQKQTYREELKRLAENWGLNEPECTFISEFNEDSKRELPHGTVRQLFSISNVYINPSRSESYSLSTQEAAITGNLLVLNSDFPPMRQIYGENALYFQFSSNIDKNTLLDGETSVHYPPLTVAAIPPDIPQALLTQTPDGWSIPGDVVYAEQIADKIRAEFLSNKVLQQRTDRLRNYNIFSVFKRHLQPVIND
jgi:glycosyltransferase involved in cell wall biosynthesis